MARPFAAIDFKEGLIAVIDKAMKRGPSAGSHSLEGCEGIFRVVRSKRGRLCKSCTIHS